MRILVRALPSLALAALTFGVAQAQAREQPVGASIEIIKRFSTGTCAQCGPGGTQIETTNCRFIAVVQVPSLPAAASYKVVVSDTVLGERTALGPPFSDNPEEGFQTPGGTHWFVLSGGAEGGTCPEVDDEIHNRYKILSATATLGCPTSRPTSAPSARGAGIGSGAMVAANRSQSDRNWYACWGTINTVGGSVNALAGWATTRYLSRGVLFSGPEATPLAGVLVLGGTILNYLGRAQAALGAAQQVMAVDPPDSNYRTIANPRPKKTPTLRVRDATTRKLAPVMNAYLRQEAQMIALSDALKVSVDRAGGAHAAKQKTWEKKQMLAAAGFATTLANLLDGMATTTPRLASALLGTKISKAKVDAADLKGFEDGVAKEGLPAKLVSTLKGLGYTATDLAVLKLEVASGGLAALSGRNPFTLLKSSDMKAAFTGSASQLRSFAALARKNPTSKP